MTSTLAYLDNLAPGTRYEAQVRAISDVGAGQFSAIQRMLTYQGRNAQFLVHKTAYLHT